MSSFLEAVLCMDVSSDVLLEGLYYIHPCYFLLLSSQNLPQKVYSGGLLESLRDRPLFSVDSHHRLPYLYLAGPAILRGFAAQLAAFYCQRLVLRLFLSQPNRGDALAMVMRGLWVAYFGSFLSETLLYPLETVVARMTCQGMPVLVDNIQTGLDISFVTTFYRGFTDCVIVIWESEGLFGFLPGLLCPVTPLPTPRRTPVPSLENRENSER